MVAGTERNESTGTHPLLHRSLVIQAPPEFQPERREAKNPEAREKLQPKVHIPRLGGPKFSQTNDRALFVLPRFSVPLLSFSPFSPLHHPGGQQVNQRRQQQTQCIFNHPTTCDPPSSSTRCALSACASSRRFPSSLCSAPTRSADEAPLERYAFLDHPSSTSSTSAMISPVPSALTTVRGFQGTPVTSGDEDSDSGLCDTPRLRRGRHRLDDVVSANCSPVLRALPSPGVSGIAKLRMQMDPLSLDASSRSSSAVRGVLLDSRSCSRDGARSEAGSDSSEIASQRYEVKLENDFASESARDRAAFTEPLEGGLKPRRKMTSDDFQPLRCLGKGTFGTVILVKQRATGRLYAQKQFKKASLVVHKKLIEQTKTERQILESVNRHPFVVKLFYAFQDHEKLYLILEYGQGGELFTHLNTEKMFSESVAAFYMAEMLLAISHLHNDLGVVYRDLKPENCLLDADGHLLLTDFGLSKVAVDSSETCNSMLGTVEYMAPEVILGNRYGKAVDWWSFGALGFDLMTGHPPFRGQNNAKVQERIVKQKLTMPYFLSADAKDLLTRLLRKEPKKRLGAQMPKDLETLKRHRFFRKIDWERLEGRDLEPPIQPMITDPELAENFAPEFTELAMSPVTSVDRELWEGSHKDDVFGGFSFVASSSLLESGAFPMANGD
ncbi:hypothetical protein XA68_18102 [Ophiocordyceps unilateralis]|uniref:Protein kinase domain-containing protein n=1 Tax=Ophiocordyceps unilateralis TaxID=268505 RepID=A0A2A9PJR7_OPHUN|nr:hypothetical protein XA68_18102 [Ophiocordyceps unilateralis]